MADNGKNKLCGVLNINKPLGITSFDVVRKVKRLSKGKKVGHGGTLDPEASGVLPVCIGRATKAIEFIMEDTKEYIAKVKLGVVTDTYDREGKVLRENEVSVTNDEIIKVIEKFVGNIDQVPPMYSALKQNGKKLYELAREGKEVYREPRKITIYSIDILTIESPIVEIKVSCSKGTYIRSLCYDIGEELGCGGMMWGLERTSTGPFSISGSVNLKDLTEENIENHIISLEDVFSKFPKLVVNEKFEKLILNGVMINDKTLLNQLEKFCNYAVYNSSNKLIGIGAETDAGFKLIKLFI
ncbi:tRNA pseudouridine(55) synthase TruB [Clostridium sp.]|uniref:tRNA pseudouridine(55) synthase TruB n=1 Tax=Clostridium sp. TaxID=1506 RepID=UPI003217F397